MRYVKPFGTLIIIVACILANLFSLAFPIGVASAHSNHGPRGQNEPSLVYPFPNRDISQTNNFGNSVQYERKNSLFFAVVATYTGWATSVGNNQLILNDTHANAVVYQGLDWTVE